MQDAVVDVRRLVYDLRPPALDDLGLVAAIRQQAEAYGFAANPQEGDDDVPVFSLKAPENLPPLPAAVEVAAYRIAQEAITNVARHARAQTCCARLSVSENTLELEVSDDGVGMPGDRDAGVGLSSMRERAQELGGTCMIGPGRGSGTRVLARLPLADPGGHERGAAWRAPSGSS